MKTCFLYSRISPFCKRVMIFPFNPGAALSLKLLSFTCNKIGSAANNKDDNNPNNKTNKINLPCSVNLHSLHQTAVFPGKGNRFFRRNAPVAFGMGEKGRRIGDAELFKLTGDLGKSIGF